MNAEEVLVSCKPPFGLSNLEDNRVIRPCHELMIVPSCGRFCFSVDDLQITSCRRGGVWVLRKIQATQLLFEVPDHTGVCGSLTRFKLQSFCLRFLTTLAWVLRKIRATHLLFGIPDHTGVGISEDSSYTAPVTGSLFHCQWPPNFIGKAFFLRKSGSLFHEKLVPNIIDKNTHHQPLHPG